ncbi:glutamate receptor-interacting protein 2 isoform X2 [Anoplophora glabripennis]|uniref:glutamate receptor-interacting protein 2 isoform X2 n=1 Tax=Anoplophora glabripennis TaxID=217634 RepID=UPI000873888B|nr:glutamate receptor-interacting protein 2 isoform X2 [Anoplophora glabripennis]
MFSSFKLPTLRPRTRSISGPSATSGETSLLCKPPKTPVGSPKQKHHRKRNSEVDPCPSIASFRPGSVALTSDQLMPGDRIYSVNGITTSRMRPEEVTTLLDNVDGNAMLEIEYSLPNYASQNSLCVTSKVTEVTIERIDGSLGITLRGGLVPDHPHLSRPLVITQVRHNGPAHRSGLIRVGDRLLKVDQHSLINKTLLEAQQILKENTQSNTHSIILTTLTVEYDVSIMESVKYATGPLLLEIDRQMEEDFGLVLTNCCELEPDDILTAGYYVENIIPASTADRCGALNIGDQLLAIDDLMLESWSGSPQDAERLLRRATKLQILPVHAHRRTTSRNNYGQYTASPSVAGFSTLNSRRSRTNRNRTNRQSSINKSFDTDCGSNYCGCSNNMGGVSHPESLSVTLTSERGHGYGLAVSVGDHTENRSADILISRIATDSPAYRCGCLQVGDRLISVNHQPNLTLQEINSILELGNEPNATGKVTLQVEFDVADTIVPSSGIFTVKLAKRGPGLGITITASKTRPDEPFIISEIRRGSIAHRTGTLHAGDRLLAIDNRQLDHMTIESAFDILQTSTNEIVTLKVEKTETENANLFLDSVVYTVELHRYGGPLGITISGSEDCVDPIILSRLTEGGLAEKTGALHVGDRILAINGESLEHRPLSDAIRLLQTSGDRVQLKIARNIKPTENGMEEPRCSYSSPGLMSVDSAIHSWDSNTVDNTNDNATDIPEIKDVESVLSEPLSYQDQDKDLTLTKNRKRDSQLQYYSDTEEIFCPSPLPLPNYSFTNTMKYENSFAQSPNSFIDRLPGTYSNESMLDNEIYHVTLYKDSIYDDYGFSVSDGLYEKGVYVNRIRKGGPADIVGLLKPYDRIIQVNDTKTQDFDCCLTVPLIASAGDRIELVVARNPYLNYPEKDLQDSMSKKSFSASQNTITKTL